MKLRFNILCKNLTCGHYDRDGCDLMLVKDIETDCLPRIGETIRHESDQSYYITDVHRYFYKENNTYKEVNNVYVIKV